MAKVNIICHYKCRKNTSCQKLCARMWNPYFLYFFSVLTTRNNIFQFLDQPKSYGNATLKGSTACVTSIEAGICLQLHAPTLTIPVDPGPGPDLIQIHIKPQPFRWGRGDVRSEFGWLRWLSCGRWALAKELRNGWCKHQDCSQQLCNLRLHCFIDLQKATVSTALQLHPCAIIEILCQVRPSWNAGGCVSEITNENPVSLHKGQCNSSDNRQAQSEAALPITHTQFSPFPSPHLISTCPSWPAWSCMVWEECLALDSLESAQLHPAQNSKGKTFHVKWRQKDSLSHLAHKSAGSESTEIGEGTSWVWSQVSATTFVHPIHQQISRYLIIT